MEIRAKAYEKTAIFHVSGPMTLGDVQGLVTDMAEGCKKFSNVVIILAKADVENDAAVELVRLRDLSANVKPRLLLVEPDFQDADAPDLVGALDKIGTDESNRIIQLFERGHELVKLREELTEFDSKARGLLKLTPEAPTEDFEAAMGRVQNDNRKLKYLVKALGSEIDALKKQRAQAGAGQKMPDETRKSIDKARRQALAVAKEEGVS